MNPMPPADGTPSMSSSSSSSSPLFCSSPFPTSRARSAAMGCVQAKPSSRSPPRGIEKLKSDHGYVSGDAAVGLPPRPKPAAAESIPESPPPPAALRQLAPGEDELVDGWPRWLVNNIPRDVLAGLVPKSADSYVKIDKVGQGTYSNVYKARDRDSGKIVALKKVRFDTAESESVKFMAREIMILQKLDHPNVLKLEGLATSRMHYSLYLVFEFMQSDLTRVISRPGKRLTEPQIKCYLHQLLSGLQHCHERGILHRDIKGSNLLIDKDGVLKIGDFGLANYFNPKSKRPLTNRVVTLWYRAPELLLGSTDYGIAIDLWSVGCLFAEMFFGRPIMPGRTEVEQLHRIFKLCGSPSGDYWRRLNLSSNFRPPQSYKPNILEAFKDLPLSSQRLIIVLLALEPSNRGTAASALQSDFFSTDPLACDLSGLPVLQNKEVVERNSFGEQKRHTSFEPTKQHSEEIHERKLDQTAKVLNGYSASTEALKQMEKPQVLQHIRSAENNFSAVNPNNDPTTPLKTLSSSSSPRTEPHTSDSNCSEHHPKKPTTIFQKRCSSSSVFCRFSGDQMPKYPTSLNNGNADGEDKADSVHRTVKRSNSTSEYINFSGEWISKSYTIVD